MMKSRSSIRRLRKVAGRPNGRARALTLALIATALAVTVASCRDFNLTDAQAGGGGSNPGGAVGGQAGNGGAPASLEGGGGGAAGRAAGNSQGGAGGDAGAPPHMEGAAGDGVAPISPSALSSVSLWLEGTDSSFEANGSRISKWKDSSGNGNDASEPDPALRPLLVAEKLNGWPTVEFDGTPSNLTVFDRTTLQFGAEPFTVAFVAEYRNQPAPEFTQANNLITFTYLGYGAILTKVAVDSPFDGIAIFANYPTAYNTHPAQRRLGAQLEFGTAVLVSTAINLNDGKFRLFVVQRSAPGMLEQRINGTPQGYLEIAADIDVSAPGRSLRLGGDSGVPLRGSLAELVMLKGPVSESHLHGLERYLMEKFALCEYRAEECPTGSTGHSQ